MANNELEVLEKLVNKLNNREVKKDEEWIVMDYIHHLSIHLIRNGTQEETDKMVALLSKIQSKRWDKFVKYTIDLMDTLYQNKESIKNALREMLELDSIFSAKPIKEEGLYTSFTFPTIR